MMTETKPSARAMPKVADISAITLYSCHTAVRELVEAAKVAAESLHHTVMNMEANRDAPWKIEMRQRRLDELQSALEPFVVKE